MDSIITQIVIILALIVANGLFAMAEIAVVSSRKARLQQRAEEGDSGARIALEIANSPGRFLSTIQIGITLIGILAGAFGGAIIAEQLAPQLNRMAWIAPHGSAVSLFIVVLAITYLSLIIGELVPKQIALSHAERISAAIAPFMRTLSWLGSPLVYLLSVSSQMVLRVFGIKPSEETSVTEEEIKLMIEQGTQEGVFEPTEQEMVERIFRFGDRTTVTQHQNFRIDFHGGIMHLLNAFGGFLECQSSGRPDRTFGGQAHMRHQHICARFGHVDSIPDGKDVRAGEHIQFMRQVNHLDLQPITHAGLLQSLAEGTVD